MNKIKNQTRFFSQITQSTPEVNSTRRRTTIIDLPVELLLTIAEMLTLGDLNMFAKIHPHTHHIASTVFKNQFGGEKHMISTGWIYASKGGYFEPIGNMDVMYLALKMFGHLMTNLTIDYCSFSDWESGMINSRVSKYLKNSLTEIIITDGSRGTKNQLVTLKFLDGPFENVKTVHFDGCRLSRQPTNLSHIFPALETLHILDTTLNLPSIIYHHFPHLMEFKESSYFNRYNELDEFLQLNPQLRNLTVNAIKWNTLKMISETQSNLQHLQINILDGKVFEGDEVLRFEHLKSFKLKKFNNFSRDEDLPIVFGDEIEEILDWTKENALIQIILRNTNLKRVSAFNLGKEMFQRIAEELPNLDEFRIAFDVESEITVHDIIRFIGTAKNLMKLTLGEYDHPFSRAGAIHEKIQNEWTLTHSQRNAQATFTRKDTISEQN